MKRLLLPVGLLLLGTGSGVGAAIYLRGAAPEAVPATDCAIAPAPTGDHVLPDDHAATVDDGQAAADRQAARSGQEYVRLNNQFVVPVVTDGRVDSLVVLSISVGVSSDQRDRVFAVEPLLRDVFLQVLFDHANTGGFDGMFTATATMRNLRRALQQAVEVALPGLVDDVLIVDIVRQDS